MSEKKPDCNEREIKREKEQRRRELEAQIAARKQAWQDADLTHRSDARRDPAAGVASAQQHSQQFAHRHSARRETPRADLILGGSPWWRERWLWPVRIVLLGFLAFVIYGVIHNYQQRDDIAAITYVMLLPLAVALLLMTWINKKV